MERVDAQTRAGGTTTCVPERCMGGGKALSVQTRGLVVRKKNLLEQIRKEPRVWPRQTLGLDARAIVVESERSGWPLRPQGPQ
jgi:hypothetical protein